MVVKSSNLDEKQKSDGLKTENWIARRFSKNSKIKKIELLRLASIPKLYQDKYFVDN
jgi:hypothetical protein